MKNYTDRIYYVHPKSYEYGGNVSDVRLREMGYEAYDAFPTLQIAVEYAWDLLKSYPKSRIIIKDEGATGVRLRFTIWSMGIANPQSKYYVGHFKGTSNIELFQSKSKPTMRSHGNRYSFVTGPFKSPAEAWKGIRYWGGRRTWLTKGRSIRWVQGSLGNPIAIGLMKQRRYKRMKSGVYGPKRQWVYSAFAAEGRTLREAKQRAAGYSREMRKSLKTKTLSFQSSYDRKSVV